MAHHAQYDRRCHLLRHVHRPRHRSHPVTGLLTTTVPGKGEKCRSSICYCIHFYRYTFYSLAIKLDSINFCIWQQLMIIFILNEAVGCLFLLVYKRSVRNSHHIFPEPNIFSFCPANYTVPFKQIGISCHKSLIQYSQMAERTTLFLVFMISGCRQSSLQTDNIFYEGFST